MNKDNLKITEPERIKNPSQAFCVSTYPTENTTPENTPKKIYLTSCYSHISPFVRQRRFELVTCKAASLMKQGHIVFSPISHSHPIATQEELPLSHEYWQTMNESFLDWCDALYVYRLACWQFSKGVQHEIEYAEKTGKPVFYID